MFIINMMRKFWLGLTDNRFKAAMAAVERTGACLGDLAEDPSAASAFFRPLRAALRAATSGKTEQAASAQARAAAEDLAALLERFFSDLSLHRTAPDAALKEALLCLQRACSAARGLAGPRTKERAAVEIRGLCAGARRTLALAKTAADGAPGGFPKNIKFSSIYSGLDAAFDALERCAEALFKV